MPAFAAALVLVLAAGCHRDLADIDGIFYNGDGRRVHCGADLDTRARNPTESVDGALDRAAERGEIVELYAHRPGVSVPVDRIEHVLAGARDRGLTFYTYRELADGTATGPGIALSFDDHFTQEWTDIRPLLDAYGARVTFFVSRWIQLDEDRHEQIRQLAADGHDIAAHTVHHLRGPSYVEDHGLTPYLEDEVWPSIDVLEAEGFDVTALAYPFGARTSEIDDAILTRVSIVRSVAFSYYGTVESPCPH